VWVESARGLVGPRIGSNMEPDRSVGIGSGTVLPSEEVIFTCGGQGVLRMRKQPRSRFDAFAQRKRTHSTALAAASEAGILPGQECQLSVVTSTELELPPVELVGEWLRQLMLRDGVDAVAEAIVGACPHAQVMALCKRLCDMGFGVEPLLETGQTHWESRTRDSACLIGKRRRVGELAAIPFKNDECLFCEPMCGSDEKICKAQALLETLEDDIKEQEEDIKDQREAGIESSAPLRAARYILYRKYVFAKEGFLGKRIRIRIAPCVVEAIRNRFREPGCLCSMGGPLFNCTEHGYVGHRDAPADGSSD